jgi:integrase
MAHTGNRLSAAKLSKNLPVGNYPDGLGLILQVTTGGRSWIYRYTRSGRRREMGLGSFHAVSLATARILAQQARDLLALGKDPIDERDARRAAERAEAAKLVTFRSAAEKYIAARASGWKNAKHQQQWRNTLKTYAYPVIGNLSVQAIDISHVVKVFEPIWTKKPETASRLRGRIESILDWCTVRKYRQGENPARWRGHLSHILPARSKVRQVQHHAALPYDEIGDFLFALRKEDGTSARALQFLILSAMRTSEVLLADWREINLTTKVWTVPAERMKAKREHRVPLSPLAVAILTALGGENRPKEGYVFPGAKEGAPLSQMALLMLLRRMKRDDLTVHGFRSTFKDWASDQTGFGNEVSEMALAHAVEDKTEAAYRRGDLFEKRRKLMDAWAGYCGRPSGKSNVVPMKKPSLQGTAPIA